MKKILVVMILVFSGASTAFAHEGNIAIIEIRVGELYFQVSGKEKNAPLILEAERDYFLRFTNEGFAEHEANFGKNPQKGGTGLYVRYGENLMPGFLALHLRPKETAVLHLKISKDKIGDWELGCFMPGHYEGGQKAPLRIVTQQHKTTSHK